MAPSSRRVRDARGGRLSAGRAGPIALAVVATLVTLWIADAVVASIYPSTPPTREAVRREAARRAGVEVDPRTMLQIVRDLRRGGLEAYPTVYIGNYWLRRPFFRDTLYPLAGISGAASVMCNEKSPVVYRADERGFANPPGQWNAHDVELALVGDSYAMGWCVPPAESFAGRIRARYPSTIVLGFGASGPLTQLAQMREYLPPLRPRRVLWFYYENNDLFDLAREKTQPILRRYLDTAFTQRLAGRQDEIDTRLRAFAQASERAAIAAESAAAVPPPPLWKRGARSAIDVLKLWHLRSRFRGRRQPDLSPPCCDLRLLADVVREAKRTVGSWGGSLAVVYLPSEERLASRRALGAGELAGDSVVATFHALGVVVLDLRALLPGYGSARELYVYEGAHFTPRGHAAVAALVLKFLAESDRAARVP